MFKGKCKQVYIVDTPSDRRKGRSNIQYGISEVRFYKDPFLIIFSIIFVSQIVIIGTSVVTGKSGFSLTPYRNAFVALVVCLVFAVQLASIHRVQSQIPLRLKAILAFNTFFASFMALVGAALEWPLVYQISTLIYLLANILVFFSSSSIFSSSFYSPKGTHHRLVFVVFLGLFSVLIEYIVPVGKMDEQLRRVLIVLGLCCLSKNKGTAILGIILIALGLSELDQITRSTIIYFVTAVIAILYLKNYAGKSIFLISLFFLVCIIFWNSIDIEFLSQNRRILQLKQIMEGERYISDIVAFRQRIDEAEMVITAREESDSLFVTFFGFGNGATLDMAWGIDAAVTNNAFLGSRSVHNIHFLPFAYLYRYGWIGIIFLIVVVFHVLANILKFRRYASDRDIFSYFFFVYPLCSIAYSSSASNHFITDFMNYVCFAYCFIYFRKFEKNSTL